MYACTHSTSGRAGDRENSDHRQAETKIGGSESVSVSAVRRKDPWRKVACPRPSEFGNQYAVDRDPDRMFRATFCFSYAFVSRAGFVFVFESRCSMGAEERTERVFAEEERRVIIFFVWVKPGGRGTRTKCG